MCGMIPGRDQRPVALSYSMMQAKCSMSREPSRANGILNADTGSLCRRRTPAANNIPAFLWVGPQIDCCYGRTSKCIADTFCHIVASQFGTYAERVEQYADAFVKFFEIAISPSPRAVCCQSINDIVFFPVWQSELVFASNQSVGNLKEVSCIRYLHISSSTWISVCRLLL